VRDGNNFDEVTRVNSGDTFDLIKEEGGGWNSDRLK